MHLITSTTLSLFLKYVVGIMQNDTMILIIFMEALATFSVVAGDTSPYKITCMANASRIEHTCS